MIAFLREPRSDINPLTFINRRRTARELPAECVSRRAFPMPNITNGLPYIDLDQGRASDIYKKKKKIERRKGLTERRYEAGNYTILHVTSSD